MLMVSEPDKLILESLAKAKGISTDEVKEGIEKKAKTKRKRKKKGGSLDIIRSDKARVIEFSQIKGSVLRTDPKENVFEWAIKDVALYIKNKYYKKFGKDWMHRVIGASIELKRLHDRILDVYGHCDTLVMRDYVDYIFQEEIEGMVDAAGGEFYIQNFRNDKYITSFSRLYDYKESFEREHWGKNKKEKLEKRPSTSNQSIEEVFFLSEESFVTTYGIVVCIFWLIRCQDYTNREASMKVLDICKKINDKGEFKFVKEKTESLSPYHESINFPKMEEFLRNIDGRYKIDIEYKENDIIKSKFKFLEEKV